MSAEINPGPALKTRVIWLCVTSLVLMFIGTAFAIWNNWTSSVRLAQTHLVHTTSIVSTVIDARFFDALKLLELSRRELEKLNAENLDNIKIHSVLKESAKRFDFDNRDDVFGVLFFVDREGVIRAQSADKALPITNVSDRLYFKTLEQNPSLRFAVGNLVTARVTGNKVFHLAVPHTDVNGGFQGLILQQIRADDLAAIVNQSIGKDSGRFLTLLSHNDVVFQYPLEVNSGDEPPSAVMTELFKEARAINRLSGSLEDQGLTQGLVAYSKSTKFGIITVGEMPLFPLIIKYVYGEKYLLGYAGLAALLVLFFFYIFYKNSLSLIDARVLSMHDALTGLYNRRALDDRFDVMRREAIRTQNALSVLFVDIDHFKKYNDKYGHEAADKVLVQLADVMTTCLDRPLDFLCRWGGEEFVILLPDTSEKGAIHVAQRMLNEVRQMHTAVESETYPITVSIGLSSIMNSSDHFDDDLVDKADKAMFMAKAKGRDQLVIYQEQS